MASEPGPASEHERRLDQIVDELLQARERGEKIDRATWLARFPELADERNDFLATTDLLDRLLAAHSPLDELHRQVNHSLSGPVAGPSLESTLPSLVPPSELGPMPQVGDFELYERLGEGGMGVVYKAWQKGLGRWVAIKMIRAGERATARDHGRFRTEAAAAARLDHPGIVTVYEVGEVGGQPYFVSAYAEGQSLDRLLDRYTADPRAAAALVAEVADAVHHAHQRGVIHRDLKPANIVIGADGRPMVTDFGLAKVLDADSGLTRTGDVVGTPSYMAPEQAESSGSTVTTAADVYGLGAILYTLLTGRPPFRGATVLDTLQQVRACDPAPPRRLNRLVDHDLNTICLKCLSKEPARRYASARELAEDLRRWRDGEPILARPVSAAEQVLRWIKRRPAAAALIVVSAAAFGAAFAGSLWHGHTLGRALQKAERLAGEGREREARLRELLYAADMGAAKDAWDNGDLAGLAAILQRQRLATGDAGLRGFEWHWLQRCLSVRDSSFRAHQSGLLSAAVSPDGRWLATTDRMGRVRVWALATRRLVAELRGHTDEVPRAAFSPDSRLLATCSRDRTIRLWDAATWKETACLRGPHDMTIMAIAFSPDGNYLASGGRDRRLALWSLPRRAPLHSWQGHQDVVTDLVFTPDSRTLISAGKDSCARFWAVPSGSKLGQREGGHQISLALALSNDGRYLALAGYRDHVRLWDQSDPAAKPIDIPVGGPVRSLAFAPTEPLLAVASGSGNVTLWNVASDEVERSVRKFQRGAATSRTVAFTAGGKQLVSATEEDGRIVLWDVARRTGWEEVELPPSLGDFALSPDGRLAASAHYASGEVRLWDTDGFRPRAVLPCAGGPLWVRFSPSGETVAAIRHLAGTAAFWEGASGRLVVPNLPARGMAFSPRGDFIAIRDTEGIVQVRASPSGQAKVTCGDRAWEENGLAFSPDGGTLAIGSEDHSIGLWGPDTGQLQGRLPAQEMGARVMTFSPDGHLLAVGQSNGVIRLWDRESATVMAVLSAHQAAVLKLVFAPDGLTLASLGDDNTVKLWHAPTGRALMTLVDRPSALKVHSVVFTPDGQSLLVAAAPAQDEKKPSRLLIFRTARSEE